MLDRSDLLLILHILFCATIAYSCFCRLVHTDHNVLRTIRASLVALVICGISGMVAPFIWGFQPCEWEVFTVGAISLLQVSTKSVWSEGVPEAFIKKKTKVLSSLFS